MRGHSSRTKTWWVLVMCAIRSVSGWFGQSRPLLVGEAAVLFAKRSSASSTEILAEAQASPKVRLPPQQ